MDDTTRKEDSNPKSPIGELHRLNVTETVEYHGKGATRYRVADIGHYVEMIRYVSDRLGWDGRRLRGCRCQIRYPVFGASLCVVFDPPPRCVGDEMGPTS